MKQLIRFCVVGMVGFAPLGSFQSMAIADGIPQLFHSAVRPAGRPVASDPTVMRSRVMRLNIGLLNSIKPDDRLGFNLFEDAMFTARLEIIKNRDTWVGSIESKTGGTFTLVMNDGALSAIIRVPRKGIYRVRSLRDGVVVIQEIDETRFPPCGVGPDHGILAEGGAAAGGGCDDGSVIDVLVVYTPLARSAAGGTAAIEAEIDLAFANTNTAYGNSLIGTQLNLVHVQEIAYDEAGDYVDHLYRLTDPADGSMDEVHGLRDLYLADMVALLVDDGEYCGVAWLMQNLSPAFEAYAFSVTSWFCAAGNLTFAHELGHNQGCCHDRDNCSQGVFDYSYGYQSPGAEFRTVMAYNCPGGCPRIQNFSNPIVSYQGLPTGVPINLPNSAHNALSINQTAVTVSSFRCSTPPIGACCFNDGSCSMETQADCTSSGGTYQGGETDCAQSPCPEPTGACCLFNDECIEVTLDECNVISGTYLGNGIPCTPDSCVTVSGACCLADGSCFVLGLDDCNLADGTYQGDDTACRPNPCPLPCPWDIDATGSVGASDLLALLVSWGPCKGCAADFDGDGTVGASDLLALLVNWGPCP